MVTREAIADALSTVAGVTGGTARPATPSPGQAWPEWRASRWLTGCVVETGWYVYVVLSGDARASIDVADPLIVPVGQALQDVPNLTVNGVEPWRIPLGTETPASVPALRYTCTD